MSDSDGFDALKSIYKAAPEQPIIVLVDEGKTSDVVDVMRLGVSDYLYKPVAEMAMLGFTVINSLKRAKLEGEHRSYEKRLELTNRELETRIELFRLDQQAGRHVQISMLPVPPQDISGYHFNHRVIPSLFLSGDTVDYKPVSKDRVLFYIADVSGHGSSSAFITILLGFRLEQMRREFIRSRFVKKFTPATILNSINEDLLDANLDKHITLFLGMLDAKENTMTYSVAGHHPLPIFYENGEANFINVSDSSFPLGLFDEAHYFEETIQLSNDFSLTLFSDGILEILKGDSLSAKEEYLLKTIVESEGDFGRIKTNLDLDDDALGNLPDDIAVLSVKGSRT